VKKPSRHSLISLPITQILAALTICLGTAWHGAVAQVTTTPSSPISIGTIADGSALLQNIYVNNLYPSGESITLNGLGYTLTGDTADFNVSNLQFCQGSFGHGNGVCTIDVAFAPVAVGNFSATLTVPYTDPSGNSQALSIVMSGTGTAQQTTLVPLTPTPVQGYTTSSVTDDNVFVFTNNYAGNAISFPTNVSQISITGPNASMFVIDATDGGTWSTCTTVLAGDMLPGESCVESVYFVPPSTPGTYTATLNITYAVVAAEGNPVTQTATITGTSLPLPTQAGNPDLAFVPTVTKFAGTGAAGSGGNGGLATAAQLNQPTDIAFDSVGNAYITETGNYDVRKIDAVTGDISLFAGTPGTLGLSGDGGPATSAQLGSPIGVAVDANDNVYIADYGNNEVRVVYKAGTIPGLSALTPGYIYAFAGSWRAGCGDTGNGGQAASATLCHPHGVMFDTAGNLYISESFIGHNVRRVDTTGIITTYAGSDLSSGDFDNSDPDIGFSGDGGPASSAHLFSPAYIAVSTAFHSPLSGPTNNLYIADVNNMRVREVNNSTGTISTVVGLGTAGNNIALNAERGYPALDAAISPTGITVDSLGQLYMSDEILGGGIFKVDTTGTMTQYPSPSTFLSPAGNLRFDKSGNFYIPSSADYIYEIAAGAVSNSLIFPNQIVGTTSSAMSLTLQNDGTGPLLFNATPYTVTGNFAVTGAGTCNFSTGLASGSTCTVTVTFTPQSVGTLAGSISFASNAASSPLVATLSGTGYNLITATLSPSTVSFGNQAQGTTSSAHMVTLTNTSASSPLTITSIGLSGGTPADFAYTSGCGTLPATLPAITNNSCNINLNFSPQSNGAYSAVLTVVDNVTSGTAQTVTLTGQGTPPAPIATLTPSTYTYPNTEVGATTTPVAFTLTNSGSATLNIASIAITSYSYIYTITSSSTCGTTLSYTPGNNTCTIYVTSTPYFLGYNGMGQLTVTDNSGNTANSQQTSSLYTTGLQGPTLTGTSYPSYSVYAENLSAIGQPFTVRASGGTPPYTFAYSYNYVPGGSGWTLTQNGINASLDGAPLLGGNYISLNITVTDSVGGTSTVGTGLIYVNQLTPATGNTINTTPIPTGTSVSFTVLESPPPTSVTPAFPTGTVTYAVDGGSPTGSYPLTSGITSSITTTTDILYHTITTSYSGDSNYTASSGSFAVNGNYPQAITFTGFPCPNGSTLALTGSASSGLPVTYAVTSGNAYIDPSGTNLVVQASGPIVVTATQAGNQSFAAANPVSATFAAY